MAGGNPFSVVARFARRQHGVLHSRSTQYKENTMHIILYIATSADGYIADEHGSVDWLPQAPENPADDLGYEALLKRTSLILMGDTSYRQILGFGPWAWPDHTTYVFSNTPAQEAPANVFFVAGDVHAVITALDKRHPHASAWLLGGANLAAQYAAADLIDEIIVTVTSHTLGKGIALTIPYDNYQLVETKQFSGGLIQKKFKR